MNIRIPTLTAMALILAMPAAFEQQSPAVQQQTTVGKTTADVTVKHTLNGVGSKTFDKPLAELHKATKAGLRRLGITQTADKPIKNGRVITGKAREREIEIELEKLTPKATQMRVAVKTGPVLRDREMATEIIVETAAVVDNPETNGAAKSDEKGIRWPWESK